MTPLVSIIIITYNDRHWLGQAIDSALVQTYPHCEVIVVDDGSTDGTCEWVQRQYEDQIRYAWQEHSGRGAARNHGLAMAQGEYIQFLDADDLLAPHKVAIHVEFLETHPEFGAVYGRCQLFYDDARQHVWDWPRQVNYVSGDVLKQEIHRPFLLTNTTLVRKCWIDRVGGVDVHLRSNEDWDLWLRIALAGATFHYLPGEVVAWYRRRVNETARASVHLQSGVRVLRKLATLIESRKERQRLRLREAIGRWQYSYGHALVEEGQRRIGLIEMLKSLRLNREKIGHKLVTIGVLIFASPDQARRAKAVLQARYAFFRPRVSLGPSPSHILYEEE